MTIENTSSRQARVVRYDPNDMIIHLLDLQDGTYRELHRTGYWGLGNPPGRGGLIELIFQDDRVIGGRPTDKPQKVSYEPGQVLLPPQTALVTGPTVFLAGPIQGTDDWQSEVITTYRQDPEMAHVTVANPRSVSKVDLKAGKTTGGDFHYEGQVDWESLWLRRSADFGVILFWLAPETDHVCHRAFAQTTRWELSEWKERLKHKGAPLVVGIHPKFPGARYMRLRLKQDLPHLLVHDTLEDTMTKARMYVVDRWPAPRAKV